MVTCAKGPLASAVTTGGREGEAREDAEGKVSTVSPDVTKRVAPSYRQSTDQPIPERTPLVEVGVRDRLRAHRGRGPVQSYPWHAGGAGSEDDQRWALRTEKEEKTDVDPRRTGVGTATGLVRPRHRQKTSNAPEVLQGLL